MNSSIGQEANCVSMIRQPQCSVTHGTPSAAQKGFLTQHTKSIVNVHVSCLSLTTVASLQPFQLALRARSIDCCVHTDLPEERNNIGKQHPELQRHEAVVDQRHH
jgi:hypothetical protein